MINRSGYRGLSRSVRPRLGLAACVLVLLSGCSVGGPALTEEVLGTIKVAIDLPAAERNGALLAIKQANAPSYAVENFRIQPVIIDPPSTTFADGKRNIERILADRRIKVLIGPSTPEAARAMIPAADKNGTITESLAVVAPFLTEPCLNTVGPSCKNGEPAALFPRRRYDGGRIENFYRIGPNAADYGPATADYVHDQLDALRVLVVEDGTAAHTELANLFAARFRSRAGQLSARLTMDFATNKATNVEKGEAVGQAENGAPPPAFSPPAAGDVDPLLSSLKSALPVTDAVFVAGTDTEAAQVRKKMQQAGMALSIPLVGPPDIQTDAFISAAGSAAEGAYAINPLIDFAQWDNAADFYDAYKKMFPNPKDYSPYSGYAYDAVNVVITELRYLLHFAPAVSPPRDDLNISIDYINFATPVQTLNFIDRFDESYSGATGGIKFPRRYLSNRLDAKPEIFSYYSVSKGKWTLQDQLEFRG
jgi:ABC-type branched-subunit amino acid transport system substrate-binding protein